MYAYSNILAALLQRQQTGRRQILVAEKDHEMVEPHLADRRDRLAVEIAREVDAEDFGADRPRQRADIKPLLAHDGNPTVSPAARPVSSR